ncbi:hypothetical protein [Scytonema millei]|uniref:Uncharacterized protein n=1 Tax=Scytonema millei VB511283 TaxID=1245923 RepID=A0A9X5E0S4_9CYAN|nr:hypothetical protein [Scytonema millei]NHC33340.1 hypothetical protein [Scytonema millei VB511283]
MVFWTHCHLTTNRSAIAVASDRTKTLTLRQVSMGAILPSLANCIWNKRIWIG